MTSAISACGLNGLPFTALQRAGQAFAGCVGCQPEPLHSSKKLPGKPGVRAHGEGPVVTGINKSFKIIGIDVFRKIDAKVEKNT